MTVVVRINGASSSHVKESGKSSSATHFGECHQVENECSLMHAKFSSGFQKKSQVNI